jgi:dolichol-phosphate mannosyltransferase
VADRAPAQTASAAAPEPTSTRATLDLTVVIPALNEAANLRQLLPPLARALRDLGIGWEVLVIDGDSDDDTEAVVAESDPGCVYIRETERGYGKAILRGAREARGRFILTMDADTSHPVEFIQRIWRGRHTGDLIIASRYVPGGHAQQPWLRYQLSKTLNRFFRYGLSIPVRDMSSGYRLYRREVFERIDLEFTNFVILIELLIKAYGRGYMIREVPFYYQNRKEGVSHARILRFGFDYLRLFHRLWGYRNSVQFCDYDWRAHDSRIWLQRYWQRKRHDIIARFTPPFVSTCDVGCGSSRILADLPHAVGVDLRHDKLKFMRRTNTRLVQGDGMCLPFPDEHFECVITSQVIEHIPEENGRHLDEVLRILKPGGTLVIGTPDYGGWQWPTIEWVYGKVAPGAYADEHVNPYTYQSLAEALEARGCRVVDHDYILRGEMILRVEKGDTVAVEQSAR